MLPSRWIGGTRLVRDPVTGCMERDPEFSVKARRPREPQVLAYFVRTSFVAKRGGIRSINLMLDAHSGELLRKWDGMKYDEPTVSKGRTQYSGIQWLDTTWVEGAGYFELKDMTRPVKESPSLGLGVQGIGNQTIWCDSDLKIWPYHQGADNVWGDGANYADPGTPDDANGQTAAADAHFNLQVAWDMFAKVFGREGGIDGQGSSVMSIVHVPGGDGGRWPNAQWSDDLFCMMYGDGDPAGTPGGLKSVTCLDVSAHEMSHGVMSFTADLDYEYESGGLNEANSDIFGTLAEFYAYGPANEARDVIPDQGGDWMIGAQLSERPVRYLYRPSLDGYSYDAWFAGMKWDDVHFTSGPANRFFYFLCNGTSATDPAKQSPYLPGGMAGIGNQKAGRIWYEAISNQVASAQTDFAGMREATLLAAEELFPGASGQPSEEYRAVQDAWAAVNVGAAVGKPDPVRVTIGLPESWRYFFYDDWLPVAAGETAHLTASVANAKNTDLTWSLGGLSRVMFAEGGLITPEGHFDAPVRTGIPFPVQATSVEDPLQHAVGFAVPVNVDLDDDAETDAIDMGQVALWYGYWSGSYFERPNADLTEDSDPTVDDADVAMFVATFLNTFGH